VAESLGVSSTAYYAVCPESSEFGEITQLRRSKSFKLTDFGASRKRLYILLVISD